MVNLTPKETSWINELKSQEKLCIEKYRQYASRACDNRLRCLFEELEQHEKNHLNMLEAMGNGQVPQDGNQAQHEKQNWNQQQKTNGCGDNVCSHQDWEADKFLCQDALTMEKHVSQTYDTGIFEFTEPAFRDALNKIQKQEQEHGERIYQYMASNNMYH